MIHERVSRLGQLLKAQGYILATAESCTGGLIAAAMTEVAGSSAWFDHGVVAYSNAAKIEQLGVKQATLDQYGAVSGETVAEMAQGVFKQSSSANLALAVSGIAGPGGGSVEKPVGLVWLAWASRYAERGTPQTETETETETCCFHFNGDRIAIRAQTVAMALNVLIDRYAQ